MKKKRVGLGLLLVIILLLMSCTNEKESDSLSILQMNTNALNVKADEQEPQSLESGNGEHTQSDYYTEDKEIVVTGRDLFDINLDMVRLSDGSEVYVDFERTINLDYSELYFNDNGDIRKINIPITEGYFWDLFVDEKDNVYCRVQDFSEDEINSKSSLCRVYPLFENVIDSCEKVLFAEKNGVVYVDENRGICQYNFLTEKITDLITPEDIVTNPDGIDCYNTRIINFKGDEEKIIIINPKNVLDYYSLEGEGISDIRVSDDNGFLIIHNSLNHSFALFEIATGKETELHGEWLEAMDFERDLSFSVYLGKIIFFVPEQAIREDSSFYIYETDLDGGNRKEIAKVLIQKDFRWFYNTSCYRDKNQIYFIASQDDENGDNCSWFLYQYCIDTKGINLIGSKGTDLGFLGVYFDDVGEDIYVYQYSIDTPGYEPIYTIH